jgi:hypothetical protein
MSSNGKHAKPEARPHRGKSFSNALKQYSVFSVFPLALVAIVTLAATLLSPESQTPVAPHGIETVAVSTPAPLTWKHPQFHQQIAIAPIRYPYTYVVRKGDTLDGIAKRVYGRADAWTLIYFSNHLHGITIFVGNKLKIVRLVGSPPAPPVLAQASTGHKATQAVTATVQTSEPPVGSVESYAEGIVGAAQFSCLLPLWNEESSWNVYASNPGSGAYGIPQALPGSKMASAGADWATNPYTQVRWGIGYIDSQYGSPCGAWEHEQADGWY